MNNYCLFGYLKKPSLESRKLKAKGIRINDSRGGVDFVFVDSEAQKVSNESGRLEHHKNFRRLLLLLL